MRDSSIAIIGAGVAGLATGCYAQMNGYRTRIFEMHGLPTRSTLMTSLRGGIRTTLPGLDRLFMTGQWVSGGGLPSVAPAARSLVKSICKRDKRPFVTSVATHPPAHQGPVFPERLRLPIADRPPGGPADPRPGQPEPAARR